MEETTRDMYRHNIYYHLKSKLYFIWEEWKKNQILGE